VPSSPAEGRYRLTAAATAKQGAGEA
ncbi:TPA: TIGR02594 family protein, partial [Neisseria gonorrhoeae]